MDENTIVPKIEKDIPSTLDLTEHILPVIRDWEVGKRYLVKLEVEMNSQNKGSMYDPNDQNEVRSSFRVLGAQSLEIEESPNRAVKEENHKGAFMRAVAKATNEFMGG